MAYKFPELFPLKNVWMACLCFLHLIKWINKTCLHHALQNWKFIDLLNNQHILQRRWRKIYGICYRTLKQDLGRATKYQNSIKVYGQPIRRRRNLLTSFFFSSNSKQKIVNSFSFSVYGCCGVSRQEYRGLS